VSRLFSLELPGKTKNGKKGDDALLPSLKFQHRRVIAW